MDSICLFGIPVFGLFEFKISDIWQQLGYRTKLRTTGLMALPLATVLCGRNIHFSSAMVPAWCRPRFFEHAFPIYGLIFLS